MKAKEMAETHFFDYYRQHKVGIKVIFFYTYEPHMSANDG